MGHDRFMQVVAVHGNPVTQHSLDCSPLLQPLYQKGGQHTGQVSATAKPHARSGPSHDPSMPQFWRAGESADARLGPRLEEESEKSASPIRVLTPLACQRAVSAITFHARSSAHSFWKLLARDQPDRRAKRGPEECIDERCDMTESPTKNKGATSHARFCSEPVSVCGDILFSLLLILPRRG